MRPTAAILALIAMSGCTPVPTMAPDTPTAQSCAAQGAFLDHRGMFGTAMCVRSFPDAGADCLDKSDCEGLCIIRDDALDTHPLGSQAIGQCQADDALFGCFAEVRDGRVQQGLCVD